MSYEKKYYESPAFWNGEMLNDESNKIRIETTISMLPENVNSILDVGCGNGKFLNKINESIGREIKLIGTDRSEEAIQYLGTEKFISNIDNINVQNNYVDCVTCLQVLEHIHNDTYEKSLQELARVSKQYLLISVPYNETLKNSFTECPKCLTSFSKELHLRTYSDNTIDHLFEPYGFELIEKRNIIDSEVMIGMNYIYEIIQFFKKKPIKTFDSPICILCGYENEDFMKIEIKKSQNFISGGGGIKGFIKKIWPKSILKGYWIIALYEKK